MPDRWPRAMPVDTAAEYVGLSTGTIMRLVKLNAFPKPVRITEVRLVWLREDLDAWLDAKAGRVIGTKPSHVLDGWATT